MGRRSARALEEKSRDVRRHDIEEFHDAVVSKGLKPAGEPERQPSGNREFVLQDPDGYNLVFFQR